MSGEDANYADRITLTIVTRPSPFQDHDPDLADAEAEIEGNEPLVSLRINIDSHSPKDFISEINKLMYSQTFGLGDHFSIEERYRRDEYGASGVFYDIILSVGSGVMASLSFHIITNFMTNIGNNNTSIDHQQASEQAISIVRTNTGIPARFISVFQIYNDNSIYNYLLTDSITDRTYLVAYTASGDVIEYRPVRRQSSLEIESNKSLLARLLSKSDFQNPDKMH